MLREIALILHSGTRSVVMIDDFEVPFDQGYGYDTYGRGKKLSLGMLRSFRSQLNDAYFPADPAAKETGPRRGCLVFTSSDGLAQELNGLPSLRHTRHIRTGVLTGDSHPPA